MVVLFAYNDGKNHSLSTDGPDVCFLVMLLLFCLVCQSLKGNSFVENVRETTNTGKPLFSQVTPWIYLVFPVFASFLWISLMDFPFFFLKSSIAPVVC